MTVVKYGFLGIVIKNIRHGSSTTTIAMEHGFGTLNMEGNVQVFEDENHMNTHDNVIEPEFSLDLGQHGVVLEEGTAAASMEDGDPGGISIADLLRCEVLLLAIVNPSRNFRSYPCFSGPY